MPAALPHKPDQEPLVGLRPPQFRLRTLLLAITGFAILLALAKFWSAAIMAVVVLFLVAVALHIAGNALGTQLRRNRGRDAIPGRESRLPTTMREEELPPATKLGDSQELGRPIRILTVIFTILAIIAGCIWTWWQYGRHASWQNYLVAVIAFGLLGGIWSYLMIGFVQVLGGAIYQAISSHTREQRRDE
jgi:hypothetical protein